MIRGCERRTIIVPGSESSLYETAYFILKRESERGGASREDMLGEAGRIIDRCIPGRLNRLRKRERLRKMLFRALWFVSGAIAGVGTAVVIMLGR